MKHFYTRKKSFQDFYRLSTLSWKDISELWRKPVSIRISLSSRFSNKVNNSRARKDNGVSKNSLLKISRDRISHRAGASKEKVIRSREEDNRKTAIRRERVRNLEAGQEKPRKTKKM